MKVAIFLIIFLVLCNELIVNIEARNMRPNKKHKKGSNSKHGLHQKSSNTLSNASKGDYYSNDHHHKQVKDQQTSKAEHVIDDFRPTSPGHSPGVGHSIHN
ncbi:precursor of CEP8-like [Cannabis sativa]|uniref:precursor of CEP8-like n=1 Tax=Cannabis sativa TaxID=3483 RepID=UPI0029CA16CC|nr:precursor of CEP8-like [Cannabis sativa]